MPSGRAATYRRRIFTLLIATWLAGCAAMAPAPTPPGSGSLPPAVERVAIAATSGPPRVRINGLEKGEGALGGISLAVASNLLHGAAWVCADPWSCAVYVTMFLPASLAAGAVIGAIQGETDADAAAARVQTLAAESGFGQRLAEATAEQLNSDGVTATLLATLPTEATIPPGQDALMVITVEELASVDTFDSQRAIAITLTVTTHLTAEPGNPRRTIHQVTTDKRRMEEWLADGGRPLAQAIDTATTRLGESIADALTRTAWVEPLARLRDGYPGSGSILTTFSGLRPIEPGVSMMMITAGCPPCDLLEWKSVDSLRPTLRWEAFPETADATTYDLRIARATNDGLAPGQLVYQRRGLAGTTHRLEEPLLPSTKYFWSVRARFVREGRTFTSIWGALGHPQTFALSSWSYRFRTPSDN